MTIPNTPEKQLDEIVNTLIRDLTPNSKRAYQQTFKDWKEWCIRHKINPLHLRASTVTKYLINQQVSYNTRRRHLSALRKLAEPILGGDPSNKDHLRELESLRQLKVPQQDLEASARRLHELSADQTNHVLAVWAGEKPIQLRNRALVALLFMTGMRRSEIHVLRRDTTNLEDGVILIEHEERNTDGQMIFKQRPVAIPGDAAITALRNWINYLSPSQNYIFPSIDRWGNFGPDEPMSDQAVYDVVRQTQSLSGLVFTPQDARRTFLTEALESGSPILDVKVQAGHKNIGSTLNYAKTVEARERRKRIKLRYGSNK